jgi:UDP-N-acetylglucosamine 2-epimerase
MHRATHSRHSTCATRIAYAVGARPNFVKMAPVISDRSQIGLRRRMPDGRHALIHTGQHCDRLMSDVFRSSGSPPPTIRSAWARPATRSRRRG